MVGFLEMPAWLSPILAQQTAGVAIFDLLTFPVGKLERRRAESRLNHVACFLEEAHTH